MAARLHQDGWSESEVALVFETLGIEVLPFDPEAALLSGRLRTATRRLGLGLGGRACLATGRLHRCPVLTSDRSWPELDLADLDLAQAIRIVVSWFTTLPVAGIVAALIFSLAEGYVSLIDEPPKPSEHLPPPSRVWPPNSGI